MNKSSMCQSCGMPFDAEHAHFRAEDIIYGISDYCIFCYSDGDFIRKDITLDEMVDMLVPALAERMNSDEARVYLHNLLPQLNRWKKI